MLGPRRGAVWPRLLGGPPSAATEEHGISYGRHSHVSLAALNGHLVVVHRNDDGKIPPLDLWFLLTESSAGEEEAASWSRRYAIPYDVMMPDGSDRDAEPLWEMADGREGGRVGVGIVLVDGGRAAGSVADVRSGRQQVRGCVQAACCQNTHFE